MKPPPPSPESELRIVPVRGELADAVHALGATAMFSSLAVVLGPDALEQEPEVLEGARDLAWKTVHQALGGPNPAGAAELRQAAAEQLAVIRDLAEGPAAELLPDTLDDVPREVLAEVSALIREAGLEEWEQDALLAVHPEEGLQLASSPVTLAQSMVFLLETMYGRIEEWVQDEDLLVAERGAVRWWFERWTPPPGSDEHDLARGVREQEFALVDRPFVALDGMTVLEYLEDDELVELPRKQRHMARQLRESVVGVWEVREREGERLVLASPLDGETFEVKEHSEDTAYAVGSIALGRLIPFGDGWLRSPGMVFARQAAPGQARSMADGLGEETGDLPPAIKLEAMITTLVSRTPLPRSVPPAPGRREAGVVLESVRQLLTDAGLAEEVAPDELPPEVDRSAFPDAPIYALRVDPVLESWLTALTEQASKGSPGGGAARKKRAGKKRAKKKGKKGRRR